MNKSDWKKDDPRWVETQEKKWPYFKERIEKNFENYPEGKEENLKLGYDFLMGNVIELPATEEIFIMKFHYHDWILMHPNPTEGNIILILKDFQEKGYVERKPFVEKARELSGHCEDLVEAGVVDGAVVEAFMNVVYGQNINDTISINNLDFDEVAKDMLDTYLGAVSGWIIGAHALRNSCLTPIDRWAVLSKGLLLMAKDEHVIGAKFRLKIVFKLLSDFEEKLNSPTKEIKLSSIPRNCEIIQDLRQTLISFKDQYCPALKSMISDLELKLNDKKIVFTKDSSS